MTLEESKQAIQELRNQGNTEDDMLSTFYAMFVDDVIDINELSDLCQLIGYELTDEFKQLSPEDQKTIGYLDEEQSNIIEKVTSNNQNKRVKEIIINYFTFDKKDLYEEEMNVSVNSISYKKVDLFEETNNKNWSYNTTSQKYLEKYDRVCAHLTFLNEKTNEIDNEINKFKFIIKYDDSSEKVYLYDGIINKDENLQHLTYLIRKMVPNNEPILEKLEYKMR